MYVLRNSDPYYSSSVGRRNNPLLEYNRLQKEMDNILSPAIYLLQNLSDQQQPRQVTPKQKPGCNNRDDLFEVKLSVSHFAPEELHVKLVDNMIVVEGKHEEREDHIGFISRHFLRKVVIPEDVKPEHLNCNLTSDGFLIISAPKIKNEQPEVKEKTLLINFTGKPAAPTPPPTQQPESTQQGQVDSSTEQKIRNASEEAPTKAA